MRNVHYTLRDDNLITGYVASKGETFEASARVCPGDNYSEQLGKEIVKYRLEIQQRKRDLHNTEDVIKRLKEIYENEFKTKLYSQISKHWMRFIQDACEERKSQLENISFAKAMLDVLTNGDSQKVNMKSIKYILGKSYSDDKKAKLILALTNTTL